MKPINQIPPFLNWAGGKRWLVSSHASLFETPYDRYVEPFLGSAAVFFHLQPGMAILSDTNPDLIETYQAIREDWESVIEELLTHHKNHDKNYYYKIRASSFKFQNERAAQFIYLNRTCWNGLYRVNLKGQFNVPIGTKTNVILDTDNFEKVAKLLSVADLVVTDFEHTINSCVEGDFLFVDPPYTVKHNYNGFIKYNEKLFSWKDQERLAESLISAKDRGVKILITNADHSSVKSLYDTHFSVTNLNRFSRLAGKKDYRGQTSELIARSWGN